jgi:hypothetical protein
MKTFTFLVNVRFKAKRSVLMVKNICYCILRVYLVTGTRAGTKNTDISQEGNPRIPKKKKNITRPLEVL